MKIEICCKDDVRTETRSKRLNGEEEGRDASSSRKINAWDFVYGRERSPPKERGLPKEIQEREECFLILGRVDVRSRGEDGCGRKLWEEDFKDWDFLVKAKISENPALEAR
jgi:hypothetical protein